MEGYNQLIHGDAFEILPELPNEYVDAVITDPPYNINYKSFGFRKGEYNSYAAGKYKHKEVFNDNKELWRKILLLAGKYENKYYGICKIYVPNL